MYEIFGHAQLGCYTGKSVVLNKSKETKFHKAYALQSEARL